jgi:hypothetical protein
MAADRGAPDESRPDLAVLLDPSQARIAKQLLDRRLTSVAGLFTIGQQRLEAAMAPRSHWLTFWQWFGRVASVLGTLWLGVFGVYVTLRNWCEDACEQPAFQPGDHWPAWIATVVSLGLVWGTTYLVGAWRHSERLGAGRARWLARSSPAIFVAAFAGGCYAVIAQDTIPADKPWVYTGGTVWLWLIPTLIGIGLFAVNVLALRPGSGPTDAPMMPSLVVILVLATGYVTWQAL